MFDGYTDCNKNTKAAEQRRRATTSSSSDVIFDEFMTVLTNKQKFLPTKYSQQVSVYFNVKIFFFY